MKKQVIVVVHGVGVREAGVATDLVAAALDQPPELTPDVGLAKRAAGQNPPGAPWLAHSSDDFLLHEPQAYTEKNKTRTFGVRLRRFRKYEGETRTIVTDERVIADFYWGDISGTGSGVVQVLFGLLRVIFGLAHVVRENLASVFPGDGWNAWVRRFGEWSVLMIHGPIYALNLVLVGGFGLVAIAIMLGLSIHDPRIPVVVGLFATVGGLVVLLTWVRVYLLRLLFFWVALWGLVILGLAAEGDLFGLGARVCDVVLAGTRAPFPYQGVGCWLVAAMLLLWGISLGLALLVGLACIAVASGNDARKGRAIVLPVIALMTLLAVTVASALFATAMQSLPISDNDRKAVLLALSGMPASLAALVLLGMVAFGIEGFKKRALRKLAPQAYKDNREVLANRHRLIVSRWITLVLLTYVLLLLVDGARLLFQGEETPLLVKWLAAAAARMGLPATDPGVIIGWILAIFGILGIGVVSWFRGGVAQAVNILTDVIVYLNNHSWTGEGDTARALQVEKWTGLAPWQLDRSAQISGYWMRRRIRDRMKVLMTELIRTELPDDIVIIAHSQGTVIALDTIDEAGVSWRNARPDGLKLRLITMGSPYLHLYNRYFERQFPQIADRPKLTKVSVTGVGLLDAWTNIFRTDDFIGTHIGPHVGPDSTNWPEEQPVDVGGHTNYWVDPRVIPILREKVGP